MQAEDVDKVELWTRLEIENKIKEGLPILPDVIVA
jgi:hypothetical protein